MLVNSDRPNRRPKIKSASYTFFDLLSLEMLVFENRKSCFSSGTFKIYFSLCLAHEIRPEEIGLITVRGDEATHPFMVAFLKASTSFKPRTRRDVRSRVRKSEAANIFGLHKGKNLSEFSHFL